MSILYDYLYYHSFLLFSLIRKVNAREGAILYLTILLFVSSLPLFVFLFHDFLLNSTSFLLFSLGYGVALYYLNKRYFEKTEKVKKIIKRYEDESKVLNFLGFFVVVALYIFAFFVLFFLIKTLF